MMDIIGVFSSIVLFSGILFSLYKVFLKGNILFFKILENFIKQLPPKKDKVIPKLNEKFNMYQFNVDEVKTNITKKELNIFLKELEDFNYKRIYFKRKKIQEYSRNVQRMINTNTEISSFNFKFTITILQEFFNKEEKKPYLIGYKFYEYLKC
jgi:hypothetical protein